MRLPLDAGALAAAITADVWEDRLLGRSEMVRARVSLSLIRAQPMPPHTIAAASAAVAVASCRYLTLETGPRAGVDLGPARWGCQVIRADALPLGLVLVECWYARAVGAEALVRQWLGEHRALQALRGPLWSQP